jgi:hypothetical protein
VTGRRSGGRRSERHAKRTLLVVCEGDAEKAFFEHLRANVLGRGAGIHLTCAHAHGKGASHVVDVAIRRRRGPAAFDAIGAVLDTDADWGSAQRARARRERIVVFESTPCIEIELMRIAGIRVTETLDNARAIKQHFERELGAPAHHEQLYVRCFGQSVLDAARDNSPWLNAIFRFLGR